MLVAVVYHLHGHVRIPTCTYYFIGVQKVMEGPPREFLGARVECQAVSESETDVFPGSSPRVLKIRNLPLEMLPREVMKQSLEMMFKHAGGHEVREMKVVDGEVYIQFSNPRGQYAVLLPLVM